MQHLYSFAKSFLSLACLVLFLGTGAAFAQTDLFFGDGSDKDVTISIDTTLDHDMYYHNLTITSGKILYPDGFRIFVSGTLTLEDGARISRDGNDVDPTKGLYGTALSAGTLGGAGGGYSTQLQAVTNSLGGSGGGFGAEASPPGMSAGGVGVFRSALQALGGRSLDGALVYGGAGGAGNFGGGGGGVVVVAAHEIVLSRGTATISANGGGSVNPGGGGGGGVVVVITTSAQPVDLTLLALGGYSNSGYPGTDGFTAWLKPAAASVSINPETPTVMPASIPETPTITPRELQTLCDGGITLTSSSTSGNQWYLDGKPLDGATRQQFVASVPGDYTVVVTASGYSSKPSAATTVMENAAPVLSYQSYISSWTDFAVPVNGSGTINPMTGPSDNTGVSSIVIKSTATYMGKISVDNKTGVVSISDAAPAGTHAITIRATDKCGAITDATFQLIVDK